MLYRHKSGIGLRKVDRMDLPLLLDLKNESWFGTHRVSILNMLDQERWFESQPADGLVLIAEDQSRPAPFEQRVGVYKIANIDWVSRRYDSAHDVFAYARRAGYGHSVLQAGVDFGFEVLNMHRLDTEVLATNVASLKTALKAGFVQEGMKRQAVHKCGQWLDSIVLGLLREDWEKLPRVREWSRLCNVSYTSSHVSGPPV